jgi:hypothetical protein
MGCGRNKLPGFVNVDAAPASEPDELWDLERTPWPWPDNSAEEVWFIHSLEHMGGDPKVFLAIMQELYRICAPGASVRIHVPHPRHDDFIGDPTHVRAITSQTMKLFDRQLNDAWIAGKFSNTPLAHYTGVDFQVERTSLILEEPYASKLTSGELSNDEATAIVRERNNIVREIQMTLRVRKDAPPSA